MESMHCAACPCVRCATAWFCPALRARLSAGLGLSQPPVIFHFASERIAFTAALRLIPFSLHLSLRHS